MVQVGPIQGPGWASSMVQVGLVLNWEYLGWGMYFWGWGPFGGDKVVVHGGLKKKMV